MKRLYTSFPPSKQVAGFYPLHLINAPASTMPWANDSVAQQSPFSFSHRSFNIL
jgi:hypothetical protein